MRSADIRSADIRIIEIRIIVMALVCLLVSKQFCIDAAETYGPVAQEKKSGSSLR